MHSPYIEPVIGGKITALYAFALHCAPAFCADGSFDGSSLLIKPPDEGNVLAAQHQVDEIEGWTDKEAATIQLEDLQQSTAAYDKALYDKNLTLWRLHSVRNQVIMWEPRPETGDHLKVFMLQWLDEAIDAEAYPVEPPPSLLSDAEYKQHRLEAARKLAATARSTYEKALEKYRRDCTWRSALIADLGTMEPESATTETPPKP